jgi:hypothetical protein
MRLVGKIPHPVFLISIHLYNGKYILDLEAGPFKQSYKIPETEVKGSADIEKLVDEAFLQRTTERFRSMRDDMAEAFQKHLL